MTLSNSAMNLSALALRSSSLLVVVGEVGHGWRLPGPQSVFWPGERDHHRPRTRDRAGGDAGRAPPSPSTPTAATTTGSRTTPRKDDVARAYVTGEAIDALCGKKWVPTRDPSRYPICPTCVERKAAGWTL